MMLLYKFSSADRAVNNIEDGRMRVSRFEELNDPFELLPNLRFKYEKRQKYHKVYRNVCREYGVLCFCQTRMEPTLWAHYAEKHTGIALGFQITDPRLREVQYIPKRIGFELTEDENKNRELFLQLASKKNKKWSYEEEWRMVVKLDECIPENGHYFFPFGKNLKPREIVLGCRFEEAREMEIVKLANGHNLDLLYTRAEWGGFKITKNGSRPNLIRA